MRLQVADPWTEDDGRAFRAGEIYEFNRDRAVELMEEGRAHPPDVPPRHPETGEPFESPEDLEEQLARELYAAEREESLAERDLDDAQGPAEDLARDRLRVEREIGELERQLAEKREALETLEEREAEAEEVREQAEGRLEEVRQHRAEKHEQVEWAKQWSPFEQFDGTRAALVLCFAEGLNPADVEGTGEGGQIIKSDVQRVLKEAGSGD